MKKLLFTLLIGAAAFAQRPYTFNVTRGPSAFFQGDTAWMTAYATSGINWSVTFTPGSNIVSAPGNTFTDTQAFFFTGDPAGGSTLPSSINKASPYMWCNVVAGSTGRVVQYGLGQALGRDCADAVAGNYFTPFNVGDVGSGTNYMSAMNILYTLGVGTNVLLNITHVPAGVTVGTVICDQGSTYVTCPLSGGKPQSGLGRFPFIIPLIVSDSATPGADTLEYTLECVTPNATCSNISVVTPVEVLAKASIPHQHPSSIPALNAGNVTTWEGRMNTSANTWCTNPAAGTINPAPLPALQVCSGSACWAQAWYYDGAWDYYQWADYTGVTNWNNCGNTLASFYADAISNQVQTPGVQTFLMGFFFGPNRYCRTCNMKGRVALNRANQYQVDFLRNGQTFDSAIRESAYSMDFIVQWAIVNGYRDFADLQARNPTKATAMLTNASRLRSLMMSQLGTTFMEMQTFMTGLCFEALIFYHEFNSDPVELDRTLQVTKYTLDYWTANMYNVVPGSPNQISQHSGDGYAGWMVGTPPNTPVPAGPYCSANCRTERGNEGLNYMVLSPFWWYWWQTDQSSYMTTGDNVFGAAVAYAMNTSGKEAGEKGKSIPAVVLRTTGVWNKP